MLQSIHLQIIEPSDYRHTYTTLHADGMLSLQHARNYRKSRSCTTWCFRTLYMKPITSKTEVKHLCFPLLQREYLHGTSRTGRCHLYFQPLSLLWKTLTTLLSGWRKLGKPFANNTDRWRSAAQRLGSRWAKTGPWTLGRVPVKCGPVDLRTGYM